MRCMLSLADISQKEYLREASMMLIKVKNSF